MYATYVKVAMKDGNNMIFRYAERPEKDADAPIMIFKWLSKELDQCCTYIPIENIRHITVRPLKEQEEEIK